MDRLTPKNSDPKTLLTSLCSNTDKRSAETVDSVYEINIQSSVWLKVNNPSSEKLALATVAPVALEKTSSESVKVGLKVFANPFIESYYPVLKGSISQDSRLKTSKADVSVDEKFYLEEKSIEENVDKEDNCYVYKENHFKYKEVEDSSLKTSKADVSVEGKPGLKEKTIEENLEKDERYDAFTEKNFKSEEVESESSKAYLKVKENFKRQIIENFISKNKKENFKGFPQEDKAEEDQWHLHHHEHHHHYYFDSSKSGRSHLLSSGLKPSGFNPPELFSQSGKKLNKEKNHKESNVIEKNFKERSNPTCMYEYSERPVSCQSNMNLRSSSGVTFVKSKAEDSTENENTSDSLTKPYYKNRHATSLRPSSSIDSVLHVKRSDLIMTHNYSETELSKYDTEDGTTTENVLLQSHSYAMLSSSEKNSSKRTLKTDYSKLVESLKKLDGFLGSKKSNESKKEPKVSYVRCECMTEENVQSSDFDEKKVETIECPNNQRYGEKEISNPNSLNIVLKAASKNTGALPLYAKKSSIQFEQNKVPSRIWIEKLRRELNEIKKALRHYEERRWNKTKRSLTFILKEDESSQLSFRGHGISVYSSKTFILDAGKLSLSKVLNGSGIKSKQKRSLCLEGKISYNLLPSRNHQRKLSHLRSDKRTNTGLDGDRELTSKYSKI